MIYILEPHGDDALISCYPLLSDPSLQISVVTLGSSRSSLRLTEHFPSIKEVRYVDLYEVSIHIARASYHRDFKSWQRSGPPSEKTPWMWQQEVTENLAGELWKESYNLLSEYLDKFFELTMKSGDLVLAPIGIVHPYHILVSKYVTQYQSFVRPDLKYGYYSDAPYNGAAWTRPIEDSHPKIPSLKLTSWTPEVDDYKEKVFRSVYPLEVQKLFRFSFKETIQNPYRIYLP